jgi:hypothetical protein
MHNRNQTNCPKSRVFGNDYQMRSEAGEVANATFLRERARDVLMIGWRIVYPVAATAGFGGLNVLFGSGLLGEMRAAKESDQRPRIFFAKNFFWVDIRPKREDSWVG